MASERHPFWTKKVVGITTAMSVQNYRQMDHGFVKLFCKKVDYIDYMAQIEIT